MLHVREIVILSTTYILLERIVLVSIYSSMSACATCVLTAKTTHIYSELNI